MEAREADVLRELDRLRLEVAELRASRKRLALTADDERRSLERALHDGVQQQLVGLGANLELAVGSLDTEPEAAKALLAEMERDARKALEESRKLAHRIYPPLLEAGGLVAALRSAAVSADVWIRIDVATDAATPPEIAGAVYFCCLGVLENAAAGTPVAVTVRNDKEGLAFEIVADDVDAERLQLRDRVEALGGRLTIWSGIDYRTRVAGSLPLSG